MSKYIDIEKFDCLVFEGKSMEFVEGAEYVLDQIDNTPTADVEVKRYGKWTEKFHGDASDLFVYTHECSVCGESSMTGYKGDYLDYHYCPKCGARMHGEAYEPKK